MQDNNARYFELLKKEVAQALRRVHPEVSEHIEEWKGQSIIYLQEDLLEKVKDQVSEKWFYTHMKKHTRRLPRVDVLNMLSRYVGYQDWQEFTFKHLEQSSISADNSNRVFVLVPLLAIAVVAAFFAAFKLLGTHVYHFCFASFDDPENIPLNVRLEILNASESPTTYYADSSGCIDFKTNKIHLRYAVSAPYFRPDTIERTLGKFRRHETVRLRSDDYALMLHYLSTSDVQGWNRRRAQLERILAEDARIFEVMNKLTGVELYSKSEFINLVSIPTNGMKKMRILDTEYREDQIVTLRFTRDAQ